MVMFVLYQNIELNLIMFTMKNGLKVEKGDLVKELQIIQHTNYTSLKYNTGIQRNVFFHFEPTICDFDVNCVCR